jgi:uncharacterized protein (DUF433 family)
MTTTTTLENYFQFIPSPDGSTVHAIRITGTRVGIEYVLREYLDGASPEELALRFPTVSLEQIYATITYYLAQRQQVAQYLDSVWSQQVSDASSSTDESEHFVATLRRKLAAARHEWLESSQHSNSAGQ